jgi:NADPH:quinone reductase-like Zn-dependent oxidoreductase/aryl carrier-like protein
VGEGRSSLALAQSPLIGLGRVIANEHPHFRCTMIDLGPGSGVEDAGALLNEILFPDEENEVALRNGTRHILRAVRSSLNQCRDRRLHLRTIPTDPVRLEVSAPGMLENLILRPAQRDVPGTGEVEIRVVAASLNFRDVLKTVGIYPSDTPEWHLLGDECAGVVTAVGPGVSAFREGDEVIAVTSGSFGSYVAANAALVVKMPSHMQPEEATTIPIAFLTAYYALHHVARVGAGDKVLVHAATGGVGLAALQIAQLAGAEVYATAGSAEKRAFLKAIGVKHVMDSRTLSFASEIRKMTGGKGVDVVLNSLAGEAIHKGLECLAPYGRFLEIGKRDIYQNNRLAMRVFKDNISFSAIDLAKVMTEKPVLLRSLLDELMQLFEARKLHPLPHSVYPLADAQNAFRVMWQAQHIGKIVLSFLPQTLEVAVPNKSPLRFSADATYMITGGLGGFGLEVAHWMVRQGARHLMLVGRKGATTEEVRERIAVLEAEGARVQVATADVSRNEDVTRVLEEIRTSMPPLRGIMHAAMVLEDGILMRLTSERFRAVMAPKVQGAWNLHCLTAELPLEHFVLFSSVATMIGNPGQGNYTAANMFLDMLAHYRRSIGLPGLAVDWGHIADAGYVSRNAKVAQHLDSVGLMGITAAQATQVLGQLLLQGGTQAVVAKVNWRLWSQAVPPSASPRYALIASNSGGGTETASPAQRIQDAILSASQEDRKHILRKYIVTQLARVLGSSEEKIRSDQPLIELGMDSLMTIELKNKIEKETGLSLPTVILMRGPSIEALTELLLQQLSAPQPSAMTSEPTEQIQPAAHQERAPVEGTLPDISALSEKELDAMLSTLADEKVLNEFLREKDRRRHAR